MHTLKGFKQVLIAYLAMNSYLDKVVQPSYTLHKSGQRLCPDLAKQCLTF